MKKRLTERINTFFYMFPRRGHEFGTVRFRLSVGPTGLLCSPTF